MPDEYTFALRQIDQARGDFYAIESDLDVIMKQLARLPTRKELAQTALLATLTGAAIVLAGIRVGSVTTPSLTGTFRSAPAVMLTRPRSRLPRRDDLAQAHSDSRTCRGGQAHASHRRRIARAGILPISAGHDVHREQVRRSCWAWMMGTEEPDD